MRRPGGGGPATGKAVGPVAVYTYEMIYLGTFASLDPTEGTNNFVSENAAALVGQTFGSTGDPVWENIVVVAMDDANNNGTIAEDAGQGEFLTYDIGAGVVSSRLDSTVAYTMTITYLPGSGLPPATVTAGILQDEAGNIFLLGPQTAGASNTALGAAAIQQITIGPVAKADYSGVAVPRFAVDFLCFGRGTRIATPGGEVPVERLRPGDLVVTVDGGAVPLRLLAGRRVAAEGRLAPVVVPKGAIGNRRELVLSPQHRLLVSGAEAELLFGMAELLVPAVALVGAGRATRREGGFVDYFHLVFDRHEIVLAEGAPAESLHVGPGSLERMPPALRQEVLEIFPDAAEWAGPRRRSARPCLTAREGEVLARAMPRIAAPGATAVQPSGFSNQWWA